MRKAFAILAIAFMAITSGNALTIIPVEFPSQIQWSDKVVRATVLQVTEGKTETRVTLKVTEAYKGAKVGETIEIVTPGGSNIRFCGLPTFHAGDDLYLPLIGNSPIPTPCAGLSLMPIHDGRVTVYNTEMPDEALQALESCKPCKHDHSSTKGKEWELARPINVDKEYDAEGRLLVTHYWLPPSERKDEESAGEAPAQSSISEALAVTLENEGAGKEAKILRAFQSRSEGKPSASLSIKEMQSLLQATTHALSIAEGQD